MSLDRLERFIQRSGGLALLAPLTAVYLGLWRSMSHAKGRVNTNTPGAAQHLLRGSAPLYLTLSILGFGLLYRLWRPIGLTLTPLLRATALISGALLYFPGLALILWGRLTLGEMHHISTAVGAQLYADHRLITHGPYAIVRHPMYIGGIMAEIGALLLYRTWTTLLIALNALSLAARARREEEVLAAQFGPQWQTYARRVPGWFPKLWG